MKNIIGIVRKELVGNVIKFLREDDPLKREAVLVRSVEFAQSNVGYVVLVCGVIAGTSKPVRYFLDTEEDFDVLAVEYKPESAPVKTNWASAAIKKLRCGQTAQLRPHGNSMSGKIESGQLVTLVPYAEGERAQKGDIVLVKVRNTVYLHLVKAVRGDQYQIGNNRGRINGWTKAENVYGKCVKVED
jgi:hypothetical protein